MGKLVIEDIDDAVLDGLLRRAQRNSVSVEQEAKGVLQRSVQGPTRRELVERAEAIAAMTPREIPQTDTVQLLREDRSR